MQIKVTISSHGTSLGSAEFYIRKKKKHAKHLMDVNDRVSIVSSSPSKNRKMVVEPVERFKGIVKHKSYGFLSIFRERLLSFECDHLVLYKFTAKDTITASKVLVI